MLAHHHHLVTAKEAESYTATHLANALVWMSVIDVKSLEETTIIVRIILVKPAG